MMKNSGSIQAKLWKNEVFLAAFNAPGGAATLTLITSKLTWLASIFPDMSPHILRDEEVSSRHFPPGDVHCSRVCFLCGELIELTELQPLSAQRRLVLSLKTSSGKCVWLIFPFLQSSFKRSLQDIQFNSVLFIKRQITTIVISRHLNNTVQVKPIGIQFIVIII